MDRMNTLIAQIRNVVPKGVKIVATIVFSIGVIGMATFAFRAGMSDVHATHGLPPAVLLSGGSLFFGTLIAAWLLTLGYIYADAKRRGMPPVLWVLVALMVPNLIGFILYFALRKPLLSACASCGQGVMPGQKFCPSCGREQGTNSSSSPTSSTGSVSLNRQSDGLAQKSFATGLTVWVVIFAAKGMFASWKHATVDAGGWLILAGFCALLVVLLQPRRVQRQTP
jgi:hypothetical protein